MYEVHAIFGGGGGPQHRCSTKQMIVYGGVQVFPIYSLCMIGFFPVKPVQRKGQLWSYLCCGGLLSPFIQSGRTVAVCGPGKIVAMQMGQNVSPTDHSKGFSIQLQRFLSSVVVPWPSL